MRVLFLLSQDLQSPTGLGRYLPLAQGLRHLGYQVSIAALHGNFRSLDKTHYELDGVDVYYVGQMHVLKSGNVKRYYPANQLLSISLHATWALSQAALSIPADIIHIGKPHPMNSIAGILSKFLQDRVLFLDCDDFEAASNRFEGAWQQQGVAWFEKNVPRHVHHITTHTTYLRDRMVTSGIPKKRISLLPNGVDPRRFPVPDPIELEILRSQLDINGRKVIAFIGTMSLPSHPVDLLLEAFKIVHQNLPETVLLLVGGGEDFQHLQVLARELNLEEAVRFCGRIHPDQVSLYYHLADVSVDPVHDNDAARGRSPLKMFESWICGVPFVTADIGDRRMLIGSPPAGLLAKPGNAISFADELQKVLESPELCASLTKRGLEKVPFFFWDYLASTLDEIYKKNYLK